MQRNVTDEMLQKTIGGRESAYARRRMMALMGVVAKKTATMAMRVIASNQF